MSQEQKPEEFEEDFDVFGSEDESEAQILEDKAKEAQKRIDARNAAKGKQSIAKSIIVMDIKSWGTEISLDELAEKVKAYEKDGLVWGSHTKVPIGFGLEKLQQTLVIEDEKVPSLDEITEDLEEQLEDYIQSIDLVSFNKL
ncbi:hypothetical protein GEMRC1_011355 [Eukaryota sp. GEM-RC1]